MADGEFSRRRSARLQAHPRDPRRQGLRFDLGQAHDRRRPGRLDDRSPLRARLRQAWLQQDPHAAHHRSLQPAAERRPAAQPVLEPLPRSLRVGGTISPCSTWACGRRLTWHPPRAPSRAMSRQTYGGGANGRAAARRGSSAAGARVVRLPLGKDDIRPTFRRERAALKRGVWPVAGCDEAGRGPLAGPVVAAAVILDPKRVPRGLDDSKKLDPATREKLYAKICASAEVAVALAPPARIDRDNILRASLWALARAVAALPVKPRLVFVDGRDRIDAGCDCQAVISGDAIIASIAAASIVAKVTRDRLMTRLGLIFPGYGFEHHKGYSVPEHFAALARLGPTIHHRRSFAPVAAAYGDVVTADMASGGIEPGALPL